MRQFSHGMARAVATALKVLLSEKHVYQGVDVDITFRGRRRKSYTISEKDRLWYLPACTRFRRRLRGQPFSNKEVPLYFLKV